MLLFYDTETTGLPIWKEPSGQVNQPHIVQLAAILTDDEGEEKEVLDLIIKPDGWVIPEDMTKIHGITMEHANEYGVEESWAVEQFMDLMNQTDKRIGHGEPFDARILRIAFKRYSHEMYADNIFKDFPRACTCVMAKSIVNLPPTAKMLAANRKTPKPPTLEETYQFLFGEKLEGAHNGLIDAQACKRVYFEILKRAAA